MANSSSGPGRSERKLRRANKTSAKVRHQKVTTTATTTAKRHEQQEQQL